MKKKKDDLTNTKYDTMPCNDLQSDHELGGWDARLASMSDEGISTGLENSNAQTLQQQASMQDAKRGIWV